MEAIMNVIGKEEGRDSEGLRFLQEYQLLTRRQTASLLKVCMRTLDFLIKSGALKTVKPTGMRAVRLLKSDVESFIRESRNNNQQGRC